MITIVGVSIGLSAIGIDAWFHTTFTIHILEALIWLDKKLEILLANKVEEDGTEKSPYFIYKVFRTVFLIIYSIIFFLSSLSYTIFIRIPLIFGRLFNKFTFKKLVANYRKRKLLREVNESNRRQEQEGSQSEEQGKPGPSYWSPFSGLGTKPTVGKQPSKTLDTQTVDTEFHSIHTADDSILSPEARAYRAGTAS
jgi:hypothetical protein